MTSFLVVSGAALFALRLAAQAPPPALRIVVIEGEAAVNVIQQKTAVAPVVEVRDRNNQPVAGAVVRFAIQGGRATFISGSNASALSVTTNAAGRAVAAGLTPTASGTIQISATAAFQGQTAAAVTIAQTNVMTAAQAAAVSSASSAGGAGGGAGSASAGAGTGAGATGGGLSATTVGVVGGAAAAGTVVATKVMDGLQYSATFAGTLFMHNGPLASGLPGGCTRNEAQTGTIKMDVTNTNGTITGKVDLDGNVMVSRGTCLDLPGNSGPDTFGGGTDNVTGTPSNVTFETSDSNANGTSIYNYSFAGTFNGTEITGALTISRLIRPDGTGTVVYMVTLR